MQLYGAPHADVREAEGKTECRPLISPMRPCTGSRDAGPAGTFVVWLTRSNGMAAIPANKATIFVGNHRSKFNSHETMWAANHQGCINKRALDLHTESEASNYCSDPDASKEVKSKEIWC